MTPLKTGGELWCSGRVIIQEKLEDTKGVIDSHKSKKDSQKKRTNNDLQNHIQKTKD